MNGLKYGNISRRYSRLTIGYTTSRLFHDNAIVDEYFADLLVENTIIIEIKAAKTISVEHDTQLLNYLKATQLEVDLILNLGPKAEFSRQAFDNLRKN